MRSGNENFQVSLSFSSFLAGEYEAEIFGGGGPILDTTQECQSSI